jgi:hypothetical protein
VKTASKNPTSLNRAYYYYYYYYDMQVRRSDMNIGRRGWLIHGVHELPWPVNRCTSCYKNICMPDHPPYGSSHRPSDDLSAIS